MKKTSATVSVFGTALAATFFFGNAGTHSTYSLEDLDRLQATKATSILEKLKETSKLSDFKTETMLDTFKTETMLDTFKTETMLDTFKTDAVLSSDGAL